MYKIYLFKTLIIYLSFLSLGKAQVFGTQYRDQYFYATALSAPSDSNYRVLSLGAVAGLYPLCKIYVFNNKLLLIDSVQLLKGVRPDRNEPIKLNNRLYWSVMFNDTINSAHGAAFAILELDTLYHHIALHIISPFNSTDVTVSVNLALIANRFYAGYTKNNINTTIYKLDLQFLKLDSLNFPLAINDLKTFNHKLLISSSGNTLYPCPGKYNGYLKMTLFDTTFLQVDCFSVDSLGILNNSGVNTQEIGIEAPVFMSANIIPISNTKLLCLGSKKFVYKFFVSGTYAIVNSIINQNHQILQTSVHGNSVTNTNYFDFSNYAAIKENEIISVAAIGNDFQIPSIVQPQKTKLFINKTDTNGILKWTKIIDGDMFYRPTSIIFTYDEGILIAGIRFDTTTMKNINIYEGFLLKLNKNGNIVTVGIKNHIKNYNTSLIDCYPNPAQNKLIINSSSEESFDITIHDISGNILKIIKDYDTSSEIDISELSNGIYFYKLNSKNVNYSGKFIKNEYK